MKSFKEFIEEKEAEKILNEEALTIAAAIGFAAVTPFILWGASVITAAYAKGFRKAIQGIRRAIQTITNKQPKPSEVQETVEDMRRDTSVRRMQNIVNSAKEKYEEQLQPVIKEIQNKKANAAAAAFKDLPKELQRDSDVKLVLINEVAQAFGQPPLHFGERGKTGNEAYMFVKKMIDLRTAQAAAVGIRKALEKYSPELLSKEEVKKEVKENK